MKVCSLCKLEKDTSEFHCTTRSKSGLSYRCKNCVKNERERIQEEKKNNTFINRSRQPRLTIDEKEIIKQKQLGYNKWYRKINAKEIAATKKQYIDSAKEEGIKHYGSKCSCCGESIVEFLTLEHLNGRDKTRKRRTGKHAWAQVRAAGYPEDYTVLCFNCNCAKGIYGECPHKKENLIP